MAMLVYRSVGHVIFFSDVDKSVRRAWKPATNQLFLFQKKSHPQA